jgi:uncharacterized membrane protein YvlD (DUF360 family)
VSFYRLQADLLWTWRGGWGDLAKRAAVSVVIAALALILTIAIMPGITLTRPVSIVAAIIVIGILNALVRPIILGLVAPVSIVLVGIVTILFQVGMIWILGPLVPGIQVDSFLTAFIGSFVFAAFHMVFSAIVSLDPERSYYGTLVRQLVARQSDVIRTEAPGVVIIQIDGLSHPVLRNQIRAGRAPVMSRWLRSEGYRLSRWEAMLPSQTSASQAGILHGNNDGIPAFRWYEKAEGRLLVSNHPKDAAEIVRRASNGEGLLSNGGASVGNLVTGDASRSFMTMASLADGTKGIGSSRDFFGFFVSPFNYLHIIIRTFGEAIKEMYQSRRQIRMGIEPRMHRGMPYPFVRAATNVVLRGLQSSLIMQEMYRGTPVIYSDYTDYDEIAHHSGPERAEALDALDGVDAALGALQRASLNAPRPYRFVVVSDHGQSLGATFLQRYGITLQEVIKVLMGGQASVAAATDTAEQYGQINTFVSEYTRGEGVTPSIARRALKSRTKDGVVDLGVKEEDAAVATLEAKATPGEGEATAVVAEGEPPPDLVVCASGNLALIYFTVESDRISLEGIARHYPGLVESLSNHPGVGLLLVRSETEGAMAIGKDGIRFLDQDRVEGVDPTAKYGEFAVGSLLRLDQMANVGDLVAISLLDPDTEEVAAFEELIGSHGGLGGWQTKGLILHPGDWPIESEPLMGAPAVYRQLRTWIETTGHRLGSPPA